MSLKFNTQKSLDEISNELKLYYPDLEIKKKNKSTLYIRNGKIIGIIRLKRNIVSIHGDLNFKNPLIVFLIILGVLLTIVGVLIIFAILYAIYGKNIKSFKEEIYKNISPDA
ncbi:MAG: hypothetical protein LBQ22_01810 [Bacteroidales bacterium]|jgi:hypothetical protein|nr:hypothetical protein [Bacteroidales bacterium]